MFDQVLISNDEYLAKHWSHLMNHGLDLSNFTNIQSIVNQILMKLCQALIEYWFNLSTVINTYLNSDSICSITYGQTFFEK